MNLYHMIAKSVVYLSLFVALFLNVAWAEPTESVSQNSPSEQGVSKPGISKQGIISLQELLSKVKDGRVYDRQMNADRLDQFKRRVSERAQKLSDLEKEKAAAENLSRELEEKFSANDEVLADLEKKLEKRLGSIKELFGVLQQVSSDTHAQLTSSLTELHYPSRAEYLLGFSRKMGQTKILPKISEIERLWFELQQEMVASGEVKRFKQDVVDATGIDETRDVVRIGLFNLVGDGKFLQFIPETRRVIEYSRQPRSRFMRGAENMSSADAGEVRSFSVDPTRGQLLSLLVRAPNLMERISQGGVIGYIIIAVGIFSVALALQRLIILFITGYRINKQITVPEKPMNNPLGRILKKYYESQNGDQEAVELKLGEAISLEVPKINKNLSLLKIIAAIAPLMGLLGTVTGMIITFQAITLFGAGDPKLMANGISQALVTTVLGLTVAIPTLLLHNLVQGRAKRITEILEHESIALVASHVEEMQAA